MRRGYIDVDLDAKCDQPSVSLHERWGLVVVAAQLPYQAVIEVTGWDHSDHQLFVKAYKTVIRINLTALG